MQLVLQIGQFAMCLHHGIAQFGIHVGGRLLARILGAISHLLQVIDALTQLVLVLRLLDRVPRAWVAFWSSCCTQSFRSIDTPLADCAHCAA